MELVVLHRRLDTSCGRLLEYLRDEFWLEHRYGRVNGIEAVVEKKIGGKRAR